MKKNSMVHVGKVIFSLLFLSLLQGNLAAQNTPLSVNGRLKVKGLQLCNEQGKAIQLRGMSSHGIQWFGNCINSSSIRTMAKDWGADIIRAAMYVDEGGYLSDRQGRMNQVNQIATMAKDNGMYCLIDWHILNPGNPMNHINEAKDFFRQMAQRYAGQKHILYEICNEPNNVNWGTVKNYAEQIIPIIRQYDKEAIIIVGTPTWSGEPMYAANDPITGGWAYNLMYTFHFYAGTHYNQSYIDAVLKRIPLFVTEWGTGNATGNGGNDYNNAQKWINLFEGANSAGVKVSWCNWSYSDKSESSAALNPGACNAGQWNNVTYGGDWVKKHILNPADDFGSDSGDNNDDGNVIQAENYTYMANVQTQPTTDAGGGLNVGYISKGSWMAYYDIRFPITGTYIVQYRVASPNGGQLSLDLNAGNIQLGSVNVPATGDWQRWTTVQQTIKVNAGTYNVGIFAKTAGWNINWFSVTPLSVITIQAENYTDMSGVQKENTTDAGGGQNVGYIKAGSWMAYNNITFPVSGKYTVQYRLASPNGGGLSLDLNAGKIQLGSVNIPATGGWQKWVTVQQTITVNAGTYNLGIFARTSDWNINWFTITPSNTTREESYDYYAEDAEFVSESGFSLYPNPANEEVTIQANFSATGGNVQIIDITGNERLNMLLESPSIEIRDLPAGMYTLIYTKNGTKIFSKFIKN